MNVSSLSDEQVHRIDGWWRAANYLSVTLGGLDALVFTAGIGEHSSSMRSRVCETLGFLGINLDVDLNRAALTNERRISSGRVEVWVIPTNEELEIAMSTALMTQRTPSGT